MQKRSWIQAGWCLLAERPRHSLRNLQQNCLPLPTASDQSPPGLHAFFIPQYPDQSIPAIASLSEHSVSRLPVEGHQPPSLTTSSAAMPGKSAGCSWRRAGAQQMQRARCRHRGAPVGSPPSASQNGTKPHPEPAGWGELNLLPTGFKTAATKGHPAQRRRLARSGLGGHLISSRGGGLLPVLTRKGSLDTSRELLPDKKASDKLPPFFLLLFYFKKRKVLG